MQPSLPQPLWYASRSDRGVCLGIVAQQLDYSVFVSLGLLGRRITADDVAAAINKELGEVPFDVAPEHALGLRLEERIEGILVLAVDIYLLELQEL